MRSLQLSRAVLWLGVVLLAVCLPRTALPMTEDASPNVSLAGQLLVASPEIGDPRFYHAVVLIVQHGKTGALGIVINRPLGEKSVASLLAAVGVTDPDVVGDVPVFAGGPVEPWLGFIVHSADYHRAQTIDIDGRVAMTSSPDVLRDIGHDKGPKKRLVAFGYAGWGPGQLEGELARHGWFTIPEDPRLVFDVDRDKVWDDAEARQTFPL